MKREKGGAIVNCKVGSIRDVHRRLREEGYNIGEGTLRQWVRNGRLPSIRVGNRSLISYDAVIALLSGNTVTA